MYFPFSASTVYCIEAVVVTHEYAQTFHFTLDLGNTTAGSFEYLTPRIVLDRLSSTLAFRRRDNSSVSVTLKPSCNLVQSIYVQTSLKLLRVPSKQDVSSKTATHSNHLVDAKHCEPFVIAHFNYDDMLANYTEYRNATFEIAINTHLVHPNLRPKVFGVVGRRFLFELRNINPNSANVSRIYAPKFNVRDIAWSLYAQKKNGSLGIFLSASETDLYIWFYKVDVTVTLLSFKEGVDPVKYTFTHTYSLASPIHGNDKVIGLSELFDPNKQYVLKNNVKLLLEIHVE